MERARLNEAQRQAADEAEAAKARFAFLADASRVLTSSLDYRTTLSNVARQVVPKLATWCVVDVLEEDGTIQRLEIAQSDEVKTRMALEIQRRYPPSESTEQRVMKVLRTGEAELMSIITPEIMRARAQTEEHMDLLLQLGLKSYMCVPMIAAARVRGAITFLSAEAERIYGQDDLILAQDLANRAAVAIENARLYAQVQESVRMRDEFLASVSHDLKNPLAAIKGRAQILLRRAEKLGAEDRERIVSGLENIDSSASRMNRLISDLMDIVRLRAGQPLELQREQCDLVNIVRDVVNEHGSPGDMTIQFVSDVPSLPGRWDAARLERVLSNLLTNAVKYGRPQGTVRIRLSHNPDAPTACAVLTVQDDGIGIPSVDLPRIFERFHRGSNVTGSISGSGVGLAGAKQIVEQHGGSITVESREGEGSTFTVTLPCS
jgi:signal transduction histidine kinase